MRLAIVVGHDSIKKGAYGVLPLNSYEYDYNLEIANLMYRFAMEMGMRCRVFTRNEIGIEGVYKQVNEWIGKDAGACIELHFNAFNGKIQGTETLFDSDPPESLELAREVHEATIAVFSRHGKNDRGLKKVDEGRGAKNLAACKVPSCLVEPFFGDNREDAALGRERKIEYAAGLVAAVEKYFKNQLRMQELH